MKKKGAINPIITAAILLLFLGVVLVAFFGRGLLPKAAEAAGNLADSYLGNLGKAQPGKAQLEAGKDTLQSYDNIISALNKEAKGPCILSYGSLTGLKNSKISLSGVADGIFVQLVNDEGQTVKSATIKGKAPCAVSGAAAKNFYDNRIRSLCIKDCPKDYSIADLEFRGSGNIYISGKKEDLEDRGLAYKTEDGNVCFFPTSNTIISNECNVDEKGLYDNCLQNMENQKNMPYISFCK